VNTSSTPRNTLIAVAVASALMAACSNAPVKPDGASALRSKLTQLQANAELASRAPLAIKEADDAVTAAEAPQRDVAMTEHLVFMANRKIDVAQALGESRLAVDQRKTLSEQREAMRLQSRTAEADSANLQATLAKADAINQKNQADIARSDTAEARKNAVELQSQIDELHAKSTERGLVLTLGDVLFETNASRLNSGGTTNLVKLAGFLNKYPTRNVAIEGYTDSVGSGSYNQALSQRRADAVKSYLVSQGIDAARVTSTGQGESSPTGDNSTADGRQQNRRVEVIIENNSVSMN
jgi:outer membrane protein OmpA-like peptidoglycan-associated protein